MEQSHTTTLSPTMQQAFRDVNVRIEAQKKRLQARLPTTQPNAPNAPESVKEYIQTYY